VAPGDVASLLAMVTKQVAVNERGHRIGEGHPNSTVEDAIVALVLRVCAAEKLGWRRAAKRFPDLKPEWIKAVLSGRRRGHIAKAWKRIEVADGENTGG